MSRKVRKKRIQAVKGWRKLAFDIHISFNSLLNQLIFAIELKLFTSSVILLAFYK